MKVVIHYGASKHTVYLETEKGKGTFDMQGLSETELAEVRKRVVDCMSDHGWWRK